MYHGFQILSTKILSDATFRAYAQVRAMYNSNGQAWPSSSSTAYGLDWGAIEDASGLMSLDADVTKGAAVGAIMTLINNDAPTYQWPTAQTTGTIDVRNVQNLHLHSNSLSNFSCIGPAGSRTVLASLPVTNLSGSVIWKQHSGNPHDYTDCSGKMLRVLDFSIRNSQNQIVDLHGGHCSFELVFAPHLANLKNNNNKCQ